jgi:hypothetical protein
VRVALPLIQDGPIDGKALHALGRFIADHAEEALHATRTSEALVAHARPDLAVPEEDALRSTGEFLLAARRWLDDACLAGEQVWRTGVDPAAEHVLADAVIFAR